MGSFRRTSTALLALCLPFAAANAKEPLRNLHHEVPDMPPAPRPELPPGPKPVFAPFYPTSVQVNVNASGQNITGDAANEPSMAIDPTNPSRIVIGWRQFDSVSSNFRQAGYGYSTDAGATWTYSGSKIEPGAFRSDPTLDSDSSGTMYYGSIDVNTFLLDIFKSSDGGKTWGAANPAYGGDKEWIAIDKTGGIGDGNIYAYWSIYYSCCPGIFTRSVDGGASFINPISITGDPVYGTMAVASDGTLYAAGVNASTGTGFVVTRSSNAKDPAQSPTWDLSRSVDLGGDLNGWIGPNPEGLLGQVWVAVDRSTGPTAGYVYICSQVTPPSSDPSEVMFSRSTDQGNSWSAAKRVNDDAPGAWQWFPTMSVAPNGRVDIVWNDTRNAGGGYNSQLFYASSTDGGATFSPNIAMGPAWNPLVGWPQQNKIGDYYHMISDNTGANLAYATTYNGEQDVWFLRIGPSCPAITLSPATLPDGIVGSLYWKKITASGGTAPYSFAVSAGSLPSGLVLGAGGVLSGTPTSAGSSSFTVTATDGSGCTGSRPYSLLIQPPGCGAITLSPATLPDGMTGKAYAATVTANGGISPYTYAVVAGALPAGLSLSSGGQLSGTPTASGLFSFTIRATDAVSCSGSRPYAINVGTPADFLCGQGLGQPNPNEVKVYTGDGAYAGVDFYAYAAGQWGVNVASGDLDGGASAEILTGPGPGDIFGPQVRAFDRAGSAINKINYYAYGTLKAGVNVASGLLDGDAYGEILTGPGPGVVFGPHVRGWNYDGSLLASIAKISFYAYGTLRYGVNVESGNVDGDAWDEILTGAGPGPVFGPTVRGFDYDGSSVAAIAKINFNAFGTTQYGVNVAGDDVDADSYDEIATAPGPGSGAAFAPRFLGFDYDNIAIAAAPGFDVAPFSGSYGGRIGLGDVSPNDRSDLLAGAGRDPASPSTVRPFSYSGSALTPLSSVFTPFSGNYGVNVAGAMLGY